MTRHARTDLILSAAASIVERQRMQPDADLTEAVTFAVIGAVEALYPDDATRLAAARLAFRDITDLEHALVDVAFSVGAAFGRLKGEG